MTESFPKIARRFIVNTTECLRRPPKNWRITFALSLLLAVGAGLLLSAYLFLLVSFSWGLLAVAAIFVGLSLLFSLAGQSFFLNRERALRLSGITWSVAARRAAPWWLTALTYPLIMPDALAAIGIGERANPGATQISDLVVLAIWVLVLVPSCLYLLRRAARTEPSAKDLSLHLPAEHIQRRVEVGLSTLSIAIIAAYFVIAYTVL